MPKCFALGAPNEIVPVHKRLVEGNISKVPGDVLGRGVREVVEMVEEWLGLTAAAYEVGKSSWSTDTLAVRRVEGGANNALFRVEQRGAPLGTVKLCVADERRRAAREYSALRLFQTMGLDIAPEPLRLDESKTIVPLPTVVYRWLNGTPLTAHPTTQQLAALLETMQQMHSLHPGDCDLEIAPAWFHWSAWTPYQVELAQLLSHYRPWLMASDSEGPQLCDRMTRLVDGCIEQLSRARVGPGAAGASQCFCRVDPNLSNALWCQDEQLRWVDWEYSGWGDPALDLAELRWHNSLRGLSAAEQDWLRQNYRRPADDGTFEDRLALWDLLLSTRWPLLLLRLYWSLKNGPDRVRLSLRPEEAYPGSWPPTGHTVGTQPWPGHWSSQGDTFTTPTWTGCCIGSKLGRKSGSASCLGSPEPTAWSSAGASKRGPHIHVPCGKRSRFSTRSSLSYSSNHSTLAPARVALVGRRSSFSWPTVLLDEPWAPIRNGLSCYNAAVLPSSRQSSTAWTGKPRTVMLMPLLTPRHNNRLPRPMTRTRSTGRGASR